MILIGLTGGVGMGKSTAGKLLARRGVDVIDTDVIARKLVEPGEPALREIREAFGDKVIRIDQRLNREELARIVFSDTQARGRLEAILHPRIRAIWQECAAQWKSEGRRVGVVTIPLLFETDAAGQFNATVCVACSVQSQAQRLANRGWNTGQIRLRIASQWPIERKIAAATHVVWTDTTLEAHAAQLEKIFFSH